jgi:hypothetical protein
MIYKIRAVLNTEEDVIRDIAILKTETLEDLHNVLSNAFGFDGNEMAAFYKSNDDWIQGEEFPLFDMGDNLDPKTQMGKIILEDILEVKNSKLIYVYDFFSMWTFYVELIASDLEINNYEYPICCLPWVQYRKMHQILILKLKTCLKNSMMKTMIMTMNSALMNIWSNQK